MTLGQFDALLIRARERRKDFIFYAGIGAAATHNVWREKGAAPVTPGDFLPEERPEVSEEDLADLAASFFDELARRSDRELRARGQKPS